MVLPVTVALLLVWLLERGDDVAARGRVRGPAAALLATAALATYAAGWLARGAAVDPAELAPPLAIRDVPWLAQAVVPVLGAVARGTGALRARAGVRAPRWRSSPASRCSRRTCSATAHGLRRQPTPAYAELLQHERERLGFDGPAGAGMEPAVVTEYVRRSGRPLVGGPLARLDTGRTGVAYDVTGRVELVHATFNRLVLRGPTGERRARGTLPVPPLAGARRRHGHEHRAHRRPVARRPRAVRLECRGAALRLAIAVVGMLVSLAAAWALGVAVIVSSARLARHPALRLVAITVLACALGAAFAAWQRSLDGGAHLGTRFTWPPSGPVARRHGSP